MRGKLPPKFCDLHLTAPIHRWDEALPLGNGFLGALLWGEPENFRISLDRGDIWDLTPCEKVKSPEFTYENLVRLANRKEEDQVRRVFDEPYHAPTPCKLPVGRLLLRLPQAEAMESRLCLAQGEAQIQAGDTKLECFLHAREKVGLIRLNLAPEAFRFTIENPAFGRPGEGPAPHGSLKELRYPAPELTCQGLKQCYIQKTNGPFSYGVFVLGKAIPTGTVLAFTVGASIDGADWAEKAWAALKSALEGDYDTLAKSHRRWWKHFWQESGLTLPDKTFEKNWYLTNYLLGSCSRRGCPPMALQGVWTADEGTLPPWKGDYHHDLNTQLCYSSYLKANHLESGESFLDFLWNLGEKGREFARDFYGTEGMCLPAVMALDGQSLGGWGMYSLSPTNQIWLCQLFARHGRDSGDEKFCREKMIPYLRQTAQCLCGLLREREGKLYLPISSSPEIHDDTIRAFLTPNSNYDLSLLRWLFATLAQLEPEEGWETILEKLPALAVDENGVLLLSPDEAIQESHRHHSNLMAIHPLRLLDYDSPEGRRIIEANLLDLQRRGPGLWCGYSYAWAAELYALARKGNAAARALEVFWEDFCSPNGFHLNGDYRERGSSMLHYRPFTLEGNFAAASALQEMLLQSEKGIVRLFPALPQQWQNQRLSFRRFRAEGGVLVSAQRRCGRVETLTLEQGAGKTLRLAKDPSLEALAQSSGWPQEENWYLLTCQEKVCHFRIP